jgi:hypothetical protein
MKIPKDGIVIDGDRISLFSNVCSRCQHFNDRSPFNGERMTCKAFSKGIPLEIWNGENTHIAPYPGDGGVQFEQWTEKK